MGAAIGGIILFIGAASLAGVIFYIRRRVREVSQAVFGTDSIMEGFQEQEERLEATPKSVAGMTDIYLPKIRKDFPEFSLPEFIQKSENQLKAVLAAKDQGSLSGLGELSPDLREQVRLEIEDKKRSGIREHFQDVKVHQTEITSYEKQDGCCVIRLQSAVEYRYLEERLEASAEEQGPGKKQTGAGSTREPRRTQTRYNMDLMYVQDPDKVQGYGTGFSLTCPHCGAPVTSLGSRVCSYCGSALEPVNIHVWSLNRMAKV